jgi:hypothetical protein
MRADGIGLRCGTDCLVVIGDCIDVEVPTVVPHTIVEGEETKFVMATKVLSVLFPLIELTIVSA